jgi:hypothetical protein
MTPSVVASDDEAGDDGYRDKAQAADDEPALPVAGHGILSWFAKSTLLLFSFGSHSWVTQLRVSQLRASRLRLTQSGLWVMKSAMLSALTSCSS